MPDFAAWFFESPGVVFMTPDPTDYLAVIMPLTAQTDLVAPVSTSAPTVPGPILKDTPVVVTISDSNAIASIVLMAYWPGSAEVVWPGPDPLVPGFAESYSTSTRVGNVFTIRRNGGWPENIGAPVRIRALAVDEEGNVS